MLEALLLIGAFVCSVVGFAWLALSLDAHWRQLRGTQPLPSGVISSLRVLGTLGLAASLLLCFQADHPSMAALVWPMTLAAAALTVAFTFTWRPRTFALLISWVRPV